MLYFSSFLLPQFQEIINCLSVPRCPGDLLASFRTVLLVTSSLMKKSSLCAGLKYDDLKRYVTGKVLFSLKALHSGEKTFSWDLNNVK